MTHQANKDADKLYYISVSHSIQTTKESVSHGDTGRYDH